MAFTKKLLPLLLVLLLVPALTVTIATGCAPAAPEVVKIGIAQPVSGGWAAWGVPVDRAARLAIDDINAAGGITVGGKTYLLEAVTEDTEADSAIAMTAFNKLIYDHKVGYILGPMSSAINKVVQPLCEANEVIQLFQGSFPPKPDDYYNFRGTMIGEQMAPAAYAAVMKLYPETKTVALLNRDEEGGWTNQDVARNVCNALGLEIVADEFVDPHEEDYAPILTKILPLEPDFIGMGMIAPGYHALLIKQGREMGYEGPFLAPTGSDTAIMLDIAGAEAAEGLTAVGTADYIGLATTPLMKDVGERYLERYGTQDAWSLEYYNDILYIKAGIEAADSVDPTEVVKALRTPGFTMPSVYGDVSWVGEEFWGINSIASCPLPYTQIHNGKEVVLGVVTWEDMKPLIEAALGK